MTVPPTGQVLPAQVLVMAKSPVPGLVKTRLCPTYAPAEAAELAEAALRDTLATVTATPVRRHLVALDGAGGDWLPTGVDVVSQRGDGLDERIEHALADCWATLPVPILLVGMDTPQVGAPELTRAVQDMLRPGTDAVLGHAVDGGFWALGLRDPRPGLVRGVPMSSARTGAVQLDRLRAAGLSVTLLATRRDVDTAADALAVAAEAPRGLFAAAVRRLRRAGGHDEDGSAAGAA